ncbi:NTP transferase domain-containing protein [Microbulbifer sp. Q7]|uniref:nucleotidyltransferase family protein n=1 Tax=Microbulbifer sp. Q7 TaxID=1785091 RepID=UPI00083674DB|nr:nucleotidyltransferase family protein [Microbulbifer sp. Q7]
MLKDSARPSIKPVIQPIILAAGASRRFGGCKLLQSAHGQTLLERCVESLSDTDLSPPIIVSGAWHTQLRDRHPTLTFVENPHWQAGMGSSLAFGIRQVPDTCDAALILLADQPAVTRGDLQNLITAFTRRARITCSVYRGHHGVPAIFPRRTFPLLHKLQGDHGARALLRDPQTPLNRVPLPGGSIDIDTQQDWQAYGEQLCR